MFRQGSSGNARGNRHHTRHLLTQRFLQALLLDFDAHGREAIEKCRKQSPLGYVKVLSRLLPRELKVEHNQIVKSMTDEQLEAAIEYIQAALAAKAGDQAKVVIEGTAEHAALPAPEAQSIGAGLEPERQPRPNRLLMQADNSIGPRKGRPRKRDAKPVPPS